jgi:hypothetical protein
MDYHNTKFAIKEIFVVELTHNFNIDFNIFEYVVLIVIAITIFQKILGEMIK